MKNFIQSIFILTLLPRLTTGAEEVVYSQVGDTITLSPPRDVSCQNDYVYWHFDGEDGVQVAWCNPLGGKGTKTEECKNSDKKECTDKWENELSLSGTSLVIMNIKEEHIKTFICKVKSGNSDKSVAIFKLIKLSVTMNPPSPLLAGDPVTLSCKDETPRVYEKPMIYWLNPQGERISKASHSITASGQSNGQWTCVVKNYGKEKRASVSIAVVDLSQAPSSTTYTSGLTNLKIPCSIWPHISWDQIKKKGIQEVNWDFFPTPSSGVSQRLFSLSLNNSMKWNASQSRNLSPAQGLNKGDLSLSRSRGREEDRGAYVCSLKFKNGKTLKRTVLVDVLKMIASPATDLISGQQVNLTCTLGKSLPSDLHLRITAPAQPPLQMWTFARDPAHHTIAEVSTGDGGKWRCELLRNRTQLTSAVITLEIEHKLSVWMLVIICSAIVIGVLLLILIFILCQRRKVQLNHPYSFVFLIRF